MISMPVLLPNPWNTKLLIHVTNKSFILHLDFLKKNAFSEEDLEFTDLLTKEISIALEQSLEYSYSRNILISDELTGCLNRSKFDVDILVEVASAEEYKEKSIG